MRRIASGLLPIVCVLLVLGCAASTSIHSRVRGEYADRAYRSILVIGAFNDFGMQEAYEKKVVGSLTYRGIDAYAWHEHVFPGEDPDIDSIIGDLGVDAILVVEPGASGFSQTYIPQTTTSTTRGKIRPDYMGGYNVSGKTKTSSAGGYNVDKPWAQFSAGLIDCSTGDMVWTATGNTGGNAFANWTTVVRSMGGKTVVKLAQDGMLYKE